MPHIIRKNFSRTGTHFTVAQPLEDGDISTYLQKVAEAEDQASLTETGVRQVTPRATDMRSLLGQPKNASMRDQLGL